jgi:predicted metal-dependent enzyme (double-stranded beta helix superfamily)
VRNRDADRTAISIHVYGADIGSTPRSLYHLDGGAERFVSGYSNLASTSVRDDL